MATVEERLAALEERVSQEAGLRASQDRDLSDNVAAIQATRHLVQAIAITQGNHDEKLTRIEDVLRGQAEALQQISAGNQLILGMLERLTSNDGE